MNADTIRTLTIQASTDGVDQATASLNKLSDATVQVATVSETSSRSTLSVQTALDRQTRSLDSTVRSQQQYANAESVLSKARDQGLIGLDRYNQLLGLASDKYGQTSGATKAFQTALSGVNGQIIALSAGAGPVGTFLSALGPWGLVAAAGLGAVSAAYNAVVENALKVGTASIETKNFLLTTGLAADQLSSLKKAAADFGVSSDDVTARVDKFTIQIHELTNASGPLYEAILRVNPQIAAQMVAARDTGTEIGLLAQAWKQAGQAQRAVIAETAFGRGGVSFSPVLGGIADRGGLNSQSGGSDATQKQIDERAALTIKIQENWHEVDKLKASLGVDTGLKMLLGQSEAALTFAASLKRAADEQDHLNTAINANSIEAPARTLRPLRRAPTDPGARDAYDLSRGTDMLKAGYGVPLGDYPTAGPQPFTSPTADVPVPAPRPPIPSLTATISEFKAYASAMGEAVSPAEQLKNKQDELQKSFEDNVFAIHNAATADADYKHAQDILNESFNVARYSEMVSALGAAATPAEHYKQTVDGLSLKLNEARIGQDTYNRSVANAAVTYEQAITAGRERLGLLSDEELRLNAVKDVDKAWTDGVVKSAADQEAAYAVLQKSIKDTSDRMQVLRSPLPGLAQLGLDAGNLSKQLDTLSTTSINNLGSGLADVLTGTTTLSAGMKSLEQQFTKSLINMVYQMTVAAPLAKGLQGLLGGFLPGGLGVGGGAGAGGTNPVVPGATNVVGTNGDIPVPTFQAHSGGIIGSDSFQGRFVHPAYFDNAPRYHSGGIVGREVGLIGLEGEGVFTPGQMAAMGGSGDTHLHVSPVINVTMQGGGSGDDAQARKFASQIAGSVKKVALDTIRDQLRQGGVLHKASR